MTDLDLAEHMGRYRAARDAARAVLDEQVSLGMMTFTYPRPEQLPRRWFGFGPHVQPGPGDWGLDVAKVSDLIARRVLDTLEQQP